MTIFQGQKKYFSESDISRRIPEFPQKMFTKSQALKIGASSIFSHMIRKQCGNRSVYSLLGSLVGPCFATGDRISRDNCDRIPRRGFAIVFGICWI